LIANNPYVIETTFAATPTTWEFTHSNDYIAT
jgi:hypothetical protein